MLKCLPGMANYFFLFVNKSACSLFSMLANDRLFSPAVAKFAAIFAIAKTEMDSVPFCVWIRNRHYYKIILCPPDKRKKLCWNQNIVFGTYKWFWDQNNCFFFNTQIVFNTKRLFWEQNWLCRKRNDLSWTKRIGKTHLFPCTCINCLSIRSENMEGKNGTFLILHIFFKLLQKKCVMMQESVFF